jgi:5-hydroxyisourate hydrolase
VSPGKYRLIFQTSAYQDASLYPEIVICFSVAPDSVNYHLPLLLSPHGYTTYRGS